MNIILNVVFMYNIKFKHLLLVVGQGMGWGGVGGKVVDGNNDAIV